MAEVNMLSLPSRAGGMVYNILKLMQTQTKPTNLPLGSGIHHHHHHHPQLSHPTPPHPRLWAKTEEEMRKGLLSGLNFLKVLPWFMIPPEAMLMSKVHDAAVDLDGASDSGLCCTLCFRNSLRLFCLGALGRWEAC